MAKGKTPTRIPGEDARARSVRLANKRVSAVLKYMDLVGNLGGVGYQLIDEEKGKIVTTVQEAFVKMHSRMEGKTIANDRFKL